jgi:hypothetical protein
MSQRTAAWLAWSLWALCVALIGLALVLDFLTGYVPVQVIIMVGRLIREAWTRYRWQGRHQRRP